MNTYEDDCQYETKMDQISEQLEEMMLDAIVAALKKIRERNLLFSKMVNQSQSDPFPF